MYRKKERKHAKGYVANISETCSDEYDVNLIIRVSVKANAADAQEILEQDVENIIGRMELNKFWTDAGYEGEKSRDAVED